MNKTNNKTAGEKLPRHIAIILDGNGRWAKKRGLPRTAGHAVGSETFRKIVLYCRDIGIEYLTVYAFSTENWKRPAEEVQTIMRLLNQYLHEVIEKMTRERIKMRVMGDVSGLPADLQKLIAESDEISKTFDGFQVNICLNYGGRSEILRAAEKYAEDRAAGRVSGPLTEEGFSGYLYSDGIPDPDLLIRPGGEQRISNFLLWQCAYTEMVFTEVLWPDFSTDDLDRAISIYQKRNRRYGGLEQSGG